jgi:ferric-chelate reductase
VARPCISHYPRGPVEAVLDTAIKGPQPFSYPVSQVVPPSPPSTCASAMTSHTVAAAVRHTAAQSKEQRALNEASALHLCFFLVSIIGVCTVANWTTKTIVYLFPPREGIPDAERSGSPTSPRSLLRRLPAATTTALKVLAFRIYVSTGMYTILTSEMTVIAIYMAIMFSLLFTNSVYFCVVVQIFAHVCTLAHHLDAYFYEKRAAQMANVQLPFIIALAGKNNVISFLTGVSHEKVKAHICSPRSL